MGEETANDLSRRDLRSVLVYLMDRRRNARKRLPGAVAEMLAVAAREHGKDPGRRRAITVVPDPAGPYFLETDSGATVVLSQQAVEHDHRFQVIYQAAHEVVHVACSDSDSSTWVDEMLAVRFSVRVMQALSPDYAAQAVRELEEEASLVSTAEMLGTTLAFDDPYPAGFYGRAFQTGRQLETCLGWPVVRRLARPGEPPGPADVTGWLEGLGPTQAAAANTILGLTTKRTGAMRRFRARFAGAAGRVTTST
jgi:hypothetical protein